MAKTITAVTEAGTKYEFQGGRVTVTETVGFVPYTFPVIKMRVIREGLDPKDVTAMPWADSDQWDDVTEPVLGKNIYVAGLNDWRLSTPIKTLEVLGG